MSYLAWSVCVSLCVCWAQLEWSKTAEPIEMRFGADQTRVGQSDRVSERHVGADWRIRCIDRCGGDAGCLFRCSSSLLLATHTPQTYYDYIHKKTFEACFNLVICFIFVQVTEFRSAGSPYSFCSIIFDRNADKQGHFQSSLGPHVTAC